MTLPHDCLWYYLLVYCLLHAINKLSPIFNYFLIALFVTVTVRLTTTYTSLYSNKLHFNIEVLNLVWLFDVIPCESSMISTKLFIPNLDGWFSALSNKFLIFDILILYHKFWLWLRAPYQNHSLQTKTQWTCQLGPSKTKKPGWTSSWAAHMSDFRYFQNDGFL